MAVVSNYHGHSHNFPWALGEIFMGNGVKNHGHENL